MDEFFEGLAAVFILILLFVIILSIAIAVIAVGVAVGIYIAEPVSEWLQWVSHELG